MPKMDGFDVLTYMNKNHWIEDIPVIMMSGADAPEAVKRAYALGAVDFVSKPCDAQIVYQRVTNTMKLYAKQASAVFPDYRADQRKREKQRDADSYSQSYCGV